jgi:hypothetical protein
MDLRRLLLICLAAMPLTACGPRAPSTDDALAIAALVERDRARRVSAVRLTAPALRGGGPAGELVVYRLRGTQIGPDARLALLMTVTSRVPMGLRLGRPRDGPLRRTEIRARDLLCPLLGDCLHRTAVTLPLTRSELLGGAASGLEVRFGPAGLWGLTVPSGYVRGFLARWDRR